MSRDCVFDASRVPETCLRVGSPLCHSVVRDSARQAKPFVCTSLESAQPRELRINSSSESQRNRFTQHGSCSWADSLQPCSLFPDDAQGTA